MKPSGKIAVTLSALIAAAGFAAGLYLLLWRQTFAGLLVAGVGLCVFGVVGRVVARR